MTEKPVSEQLITFQTAFNSFITLAEHYPTDLQTEAGVCGDWSAREIIAHINGWMVEALRRLPRFAKGTGNVDYNIDAYNAVSLWLRESKDYEDLLSEMRALVTDINSFIDNLDDFYRNRDERYSTWLRVLGEQADLHGQEMQQFLERQQA